MLIIWEKGNSEFSISYISTYLRVPHLSTFYDHLWFVWAITCCSVRPIFFWFAMNSPYLWPQSTLKDIKRWNWLREQCSAQAQRARRDLFGVTAAGNLLCRDRVSFLSCDVRVSYNGAQQIVQKYHVVWESNGARGVFKETPWRMIIIIWVCLKMLCTPKSNGFADHYPY